MDRTSKQVVAVKQILEDESMMNRETEILREIGEHSNVICLRNYFYSLKPASIAGEPAPVHANQGDKKFLNLVTDFMQGNLSKYN